MQKPIYLDYAATTPVDGAAKQRMLACLDKSSEFGNASSVSHAYGWAAESLIHQATTDFAALVQCEPNALIWTSGATESNNLAILGCAQFFQGKKNRIITVKTEHKAVLDAVRATEKLGYQTTWLDVDENGLINLNDLRNSLTPDTLLVSVMHVNNELGVMQDIAAIAEITRQAGVFLHVDAAQSAGKTAINLKSMSVDFMSFSGHKMYGPKGVGCLYVCRKPKARFSPLFFGGSQQQGLRPGTLATHQIVAMAEAAKQAKQLMQDEMLRITQLRDELWQGISTLPGLKLNTCFSRAQGNFLNVSFDGVDGEALLMALPDLAVSTGSACNSASIETSHVLRAIGLHQSLAHATIRFSLGRYTTLDEIKIAITRVVAEVERLRAMSPLWVKQ